MLDIGPRRRDALVLALLFAIGLALYAPVMQIRPLDGDNLYALAWVDSAWFGDLLRLDPGIYPEWRPLAYFSLWIEHRLVPLEAVGVHLFVNLSLWVACAFAVYGIVRELTASTLSAVFAALILFLDRRAASALTWIIERQMLMATLFGLSAIFILTKARGRDTTRREAATIAVLLLASALSKEYGLACALAIAAFAMLQKRTHLSIAALSACATYGALRLAFAGGAVAAYCEDMGFLLTSSFQCINPVTWQGIAQMTYNATASIIASVLSGIFASDGSLALAPLRLAMSCVVLAFAAIGLSRGPRVLVSIALLPFATGLFSALIYRPRNLLIGMAAVAIVAGVGMASLRITPVPLPLRRHARAAVLVIVLALLGAKAYYARTAVTMRVADMLAADPCRDDNYDREFVERFVRVVRVTYALGDPDCGER